MPKIWACRQTNRIQREMPTQRAKPAMPQLKTTSVATSSTGKGVNGQRPNPGTVCTVRTCLCCQTDRKLTQRIHCRTKQRRIRGTFPESSPWKLCVTVCVPPWAGGPAPHPRGRGGKTNVETRVSLCQYQTPPSSFLSPTHTTSTPAGAFQTVARVRRFQQ